jgi:hypothetical protein
MTGEKKKSKIQIVAFTILLIVAAGNYMRLPHEGIRMVDFVQILVIGMLAGMLLLRSLQKV